MKIFLLALILCIFPISCKKQSQENANDKVSNGELKGKIFIGPLCPVETNPPLPECLPNEETYKAWAIAVWTADKKTKVGILNPQADGSYDILIPAGDYNIDFESPHSNAVGGSNLPASLSIMSGQPTIFDINIDTGIR